MCDLFFFGSGDVWGSKNMRFISPSATYQTNYAVCVWHVGGVFLFAKLNHAVGVEIILNYIYSTYCCYSLSHYIDFVDK